MKKSSASAGMLPLYKLWHFFISVKLTVVILLCLAATSIIGTLIPQNERPAFYFHRYGETLFNIFSALDFFDMYHSWWFQFLLLLLFINITACSVNRLSASWKIIFNTPLTVNPSAFKKYKNPVEFTDNRPVEALSHRYRSVIARRFGKYAFEKSDDGFYIFAEKHRWTRLGVYIVHTGVTLLLIGGIIGSMFGFEGFATIPEGETIDHVQLKNGSGVLPLGFEIRCDDFRVSFYDSGAPKEYLSKLTVLENGTPLFSRDVIVNRPLRFKGINIFQSSYGKMPPQTFPVPDIESRELILNIKNRATGMGYSKKISVGDTMDLPEGRGTFTIREYLPRAEFRGQNIHEALVCVMTGSDGTTREILLPLRFPNFDKMRAGHFYFSLENIDELLLPENIEPRYYTGLQITRDPGVFVVYSGFVLILVGCFVSFFMFHRQIAIHVCASGKKSRVMLAGKSNKNRLQMDRYMEKLSKALSANPASQKKNNHC